MIKQNIFIFNVNIVNLMLWDIVYITIIKLKNVNNSNN